MDEERMIDSFKGRRGTPTTTRAAAVLMVSGCTAQAASAQTLTLTLWTNLTTASHADVIRSQLDACRAEQDSAEVCPQAWKDQ